MCVEDALFHQDKGKIVSIVRHPEEDRRGRFWSGGGIVQVNREDKTFQVGLKEEKKIIGQV